MCIFVTGGLIITYTYEGKQSTLIFIKIYCFNPSKINKKHVNRMSVDYVNFVRVSKFVVVAQIRVDEEHHVHVQMKQNIWILWNNKLETVIKTSRHLWFCHQHGFYILHKLFFIINWPVKTIFVLFYLHIKFLYLVVV